MGPSPRSLPVRVTYPADPMHKKELQTNLERMGLGKLSLVPWSMQNATLVKDLVDKSIPDGMTNTVRGQRDKWTLQFVAGAFKVPTEGRSQYGPSMNTTRPYFEGERDASMGWKLSQCKDRRIADVLGFLNPIFHPARSSRLMVGLTSTIIAAWNGDDSFNWAEMLRNVIIDCVDKLPNSKETCLPAYLAHLYHHGNCLHLTEQLEWNARVPGIVGVDICLTKAVVLLEDGQVIDHQKLPSGCMQATPSIRKCGTSVLPSNSEVRRPSSLVTGSSFEETAKRNQLIIDDIREVLRCPVGEMVAEVDAFQVRTLDLQVTIERMRADNFFLQERLKKEGPCPKLDSTPQDHTMDWENITEIEALKGHGWAHADTSADNECVGIDALLGFSPGELVGSEITRAVAAPINTVIPESLSLHSEFNKTRDREVHCKSELQGVVAERDAHFKKVENLQSELQGAVAERDAHFKKVENLQSELHGVVAERDAHFNKVEKLQRGLQGAVAERDAHLKKLEHVQSELQGLVGERDAHLHLQSELQRVVGERDAHSKRLEDLQCELQWVLGERDAHSEKVEEVNANLRSGMEHIANLKEEKDMNELRHLTAVQELSTIKKERDNLQLDLKLRDRQIDKLKSELADQKRFSQNRAQLQDQRLGPGSAKEHFVPLRKGPDGKGGREGFQVDGNSADKVRPELLKVSDAMKSDEGAHGLEKAGLKVNVQDLVTEGTKLTDGKAALESDFSGKAIGKMMKNDGVTREHSRNQHTSIGKGNVGKASSSSVASGSRAYATTRKSLNTQRGQPVPPGDMQEAPTRPPQWEAEGYHIHSAKPCTGSVDSDGEEMDVESWWDTTQTVQDSSDHQYWDLGKIDNRYIETPGKWENKTGVDDKGLGYFVEPDPDLIRVSKRYEHQTSGLAWLQMRESGWKPPRGGILGDPQGMGKTIMMIFLILMALPDAEHMALGNAGGTLIVCPTAVLWQWHAEIQEKTTKKGKLRVLIHHGQKRSKNALDLLAYDVVITSYGILTADKRRSANPETRKSANTQQNGRGSAVQPKRQTRAGHGRKEANLSPGGVVDPGPLHEVKWWRCILDEAQNIKNKDALTTAAACSLIAKNRWLLSGTPIQNSTKDAYSLFKFIKHPSLGVWENFKSVQSLQRAQDTRERFYRIFRSTFAEIMLRRNKDCLNLKNIEESVIEVDWKTPAEAAQYADLERQRGELALACWESGAKVLNGLFSVILKQRLLCNHPDLGGRHGAIDHSSSKKKMEMDKILVCIDKFEAAEEHGRLCGACKDPIAATNGLIAPCCAHFFCSGCAEQYAEEPQQCPTDKCKRRIEFSELYSWCDLKSSKSGLELALGTANEIPSSSTMARGERSSAKSSSTTVRGTRSIAKSSSATVGEIRSSAKFDAILKYLRDTLGADDKAIVFSQWTSSLDLFEHVLSTAGIKWTRVDGTMSLKTRSENLAAFSTEGEVKVILLSLRAANAGLNITAANHVLFMDCWWNPFLEEQGIGRAWRIGQQKTVYVVRFVIKCRVEETILQMQADKQKVVRKCYYEDKIDDGAVHDLKDNFLHHIYFADVEDISE